MNDRNRELYTQYADQARNVLGELHNLADQVFLYTDGADPAADAHDEFCIAMADIRDAFWALLGLMVPEES